MTESIAEVFQGLRERIITILGALHAVTHRRFESGWRLHGSGEWEPNRDRGFDSVSDIMAFYTGTVQRLQRVVDNISQIPAYQLEVFKKLEEYYALTGCTVFRFDKSESRTARLRAFRRTHLFHSDGQPIWVATSPDLLPDAVAQFVIYDTSIETVTQMPMTTLDILRHVDIEVSATLEEARTALVVAPELQSATEKMLKQLLPTPESPEEHGGMTDADTALLAAAQHVTTDAEVAATAQP